MFGYHADAEVDRALAIATAIALGALAIFTLWLIAIAPRKPGRSRGTAGLALALAGAGIAAFIASTGPAGGHLTGSYPNPLLANNAVTGEKVADETLSEVDIGSNAIGTSELATQVPISYRSPPHPATPTTLMYAFGNLTLIANCSGGDADLIAQTFVTPATLMSTIGTDDDQFAHRDNHDVMSTTDDNAIGTLVYRSGYGDIVTVHWQSFEDAMGADCLISGIATLES